MSGHEDTAQLHYISSSSFPTLGLLTLSGMAPDLSPYYIPVGFPYKRKSIYLDPPYETKSFSRLTRVDLQNFTTKFVPQLCALTSGSDRILIPREAAPGLNQPLSETQNGSRISLDPPPDLLRSPPDLLRSPVNRRGLDTANIKHYQHYLLHHPQKNKKNTPWAT